MTDADVLGAGNANAQSPALIVPPGQDTQDWYHADWGGANAFNPNAEWRATDVAVFLGFRGSAPTDVDQSGYMSPKGNGVALIDNFLKFAKNVDVDHAATYVDRWMHACRYVHSTSLGLKGDNEPKPMVGAGWRNAAAVDVAAQEFHNFRNTKPDTYFYRSDQMTASHSALPH